MDLDRFRPNVGIVLVNAAGKVWLGRRADTAGPRNWQFPQGGMDAGETPLQAAVRELREETGARTIALLGQTNDWIAYAFPPGHRLKIGQSWLGQKQLWFAFRFAGDDSEFDLNSHNEIEFSQWRWADIDDALNTVVRFKRETYRRVIDLFRSLVTAEVSP